MARTLEEAGYDSLWVADHVVLPREIRSRYPFAEDGRATWPTDTPYIDALVALALAAAATERVRLGTAVLVLPMRNPVELAKQAASIDVASGGRLELGVGAGWLAEEFAALNVPFERRGSRLEEWMAIARACWTGAPEARESDHYSLPADVLCLPQPAHEIPLYVGGHSPVALRRAGRLGDGWLGQQSALALDPETLRAEIAAVAEAAGGAPRRTVLRIVESLGRPDVVAAKLGALAAAGVDEVIVDVPVEARAAERDLEILRAGVRG
ncbi:MAG: TIGR03619 family F420-dependent LLM class oxidoreductase [Solirubrobacteraceae bacterium]|nr:TIGR03619 family F420-dependent LLM class oxidoreductase [Solirubrobacteraceae bacterium]